MLYTPSFVYVCDTSFHSHLVQSSKSRVILSNIFQSVTASRYTVAGARPLIFFTSIYIHRFSFEFSHASHMPLLLLSI